MSSLSDELQVMLPSNVESNPRNKPNQYETAFAKQLDLPGEWDVSYPHNWTNLVKTYQFFLLKPKYIEIVENIDKFAHVRLATNKIYMMVLLNEKNLRHDR